MKCTKCLKQVSTESIRTIESSNYCIECYKNIFQSNTVTLGDKILNKINSSNSETVETPRHGRVEFILYYFLTWIFVPLVMNLFISKNSGMHLVSSSGTSGYRVASGLTLEPSILWIVPVVLSALFASARVQDIGWSNKWSFILWLPGFSIVLFLTPGTHGKNRYGAQPKKPTKIRILFATIAFAIMALVFFLLYGLLWFVFINMSSGTIQL